MNTYLPRPFVFLDVLRIVDFVVVAKLIDIHRLTGRSALGDTDLLAANFETTEIKKGRAPKRFSVPVQEGTDLAKAFADLAATERLVLLSVNSDTRFGHSLADGPAPLLVDGTHLKALFGDAPDLSDLSEVDRAIADFAAQAKSERAGLGGEEGMTEPQRVGERPPKSKGGWQTLHKAIEAEHAWYTTYLTGKVVDHGPGTAAVAKNTRK